jgi:tRNA(Ile)-lysidine synthase
LGGEAEKRVGKFLTDAKVPRQLRQRLLIIADSVKIIWLGPLRPSELTKVSPQTKKILQLQICF